MEQYNTLWINKGVVIIYNHILFLDRLILYFKANNTQLYKLEDVTRRTSMLGKERLSCYS